MLTELYVDALLADEVIADEVWDLWGAGAITDDIAAWAWSLIRRAEIVMLRAQFGIESHLSRN